MTLRDLRREFRHAYKMLVLTRQEGWRKAVARLNREIMARSAKRPPHRGCFDRQEGAQ